MLKYIIVLLLSIVSLNAEDNELIPISKTEFVYINNNGDEKTVDMTGKDFILISVREAGSDGRFYAVDRDATVWLSDGVTSGLEMEFTPSGLWTVQSKKRYHMSSKYPDEDGINNMDYSIFFTKWGHALHQGSMTGMSHGCIHVDPNAIPALFKWTKVGMPVLVTRSSYMNYAKGDLMKIYTKNK
jgi:lipoprotein-anchoring transpeptidase ErfK/SrfK